MKSITTLAAENFNEIRTRTEQDETDRSVDDHSGFAAELNAGKYLAEKDQERTDAVQNLRRQMPFCNKDTQEIS